MGCTKLIYENSNQVLKNNDLQFFLGIDNTPYRFNGKEIDPETGNQYYGAMYYDPKISVWLSVDPLAHRFPSVTSYNFVLNNPIHFTDPTGMSPESKEGGFWEKIGNVLTGNGFHTNEEVKQIENSSELDEVVITDTNTEGEICSGCAKESDHEQGGKGQWGDQQEQLIKWPKNKDDSGDIMDPFSPPGAPGKAGTTWIEKFTNGINLFKKWYNWSKRKDKPYQVKKTPTAPVPEDPKPKPPRDLAADTTFWVMKQGKDGMYIMKERTKTKWEYDSLKKAYPKSKISEHLK